MVEKKRGKSIRRSGKTEEKVNRSNNSISNKNVEKALVENFVLLQKVMLNLSNKFDTLSERMNRLLNVFEMSAKSFAEKDFNSLEKENLETKEIKAKLNTILEQNKTIAGVLSSQYETPENPPMEEEHGQTREEFRQPIYRNQQAFSEVSPTRNMDREENQEYSQDYGESEDQEEDGSEAPKPEGFNFKKLPKY